MNQPIIMIGTPCFGGNVTQGYVTSLVKLIAAATARGIEIRVNLLGGDALITRARSQVTATFLDQVDATHLLFIDADISYEPEQVFRLIAADKDVTAALYPIKDIRWDKLAVRTQEGEPLDRAGLMYVAEHCTGTALKFEGDFATAEYAGTGFLLIKRAVFERMKTAYPDLQFGHVHKAYAGEAGAANLYGFYECMIERETGRYLSEDYAFCKRWRALGGEIWIDLASKLTHTGSYAFAGDAAQRYAKLRGQH